MATEALRRKKKKKKVDSLSLNIISELKYIFLDWKRRTQLNH